MEDRDDADAAALRSIEVLVYVREHGPAACCDQPIGYEATMTMGRGGMEVLTLRPLDDPADEWQITPGSAIWNTAASFLVTLPALRNRMALRTAQGVA